MNYAVINPYPVILNHIGGGLNGGKVYIGVAGQDPETNPAIVYWDEAGSIVASQPLATIGGYIYRNGAPAQVYGPPEYSVRVRDRANVQVYYAQNVGSLVSQLSETIADLQSDDGAGLIGTSDGRKVQEIFDALAGPTGSDEIGTPAPLGGVSITVQDRLNSELLLPAQFGLIGDGETIEDPVKMTAFFNAIVGSGKGGYLPAGCWLRIDQQIVMTLPNLKDFYLEGAGSELCGIRFSGVLAPFLRFNYANLYNSVNFKSLTLAIDTASDASGCISLYGVGYAAPGNGAQNNFENVVWRGWDGRVQSHYWGNCLFSELVSNIKVKGGGCWGPNDPDGKGDQFIFNGKAADANPYAVHFDIEKTYFTQFNKAITLGTYTQGLTLDAVNANRGNYWIYVGAGQVANDIIAVGPGCQANCNIASIACFEDEATITVTGATFVIERANAVGIRTASRWGRFTANHFQGIASPASAGAIDFISGASRNVTVGNVVSFLPVGFYYRSGSSNNLQALNRFDNVTLPTSDSGTTNVIGTITA